MEKKYDVISIGAALVDLVARVDRHPQEDDEVFVHDLKTFSGGAAANTAYACGKLGLKTAFIGKLGKNDEFRAKILKDFTEVSVDVNLIKYTTEQGTGTAYVALNKQGDRRIYAFSGAANLLSKEDIIAEELRLTKVIFLSSLKNLEPFEEASSIAKKIGVPVILNPGMLIIDQGFERIKKLLSNVEILILSQREFKALTGIQDNYLTESSIKANLKELWKIGIKIVIITVSNKGAFLFDQEQFELVPPLQVKQVVDTTGAGDAFSAGFMAGFVANLSLKFVDLKKNVIIGNFVAGCKIQMLGARSGIPTKKDLKEYIKTI